MFSWLKPKTREQLLQERRRREYEETDFGRRYGWWLCVGDVRVADLNYWRWDVDSQFWHEYRVFPFHPLFAEIGPDARLWCRPDVSLESRYAVGFRSHSVLLSSRGGDLVAVRSLHVPESLFYEALRRSEERTSDPTERAE